jgi:RNA polymerase sigma factor for flagellar operon FliA
LLNEAQSYCILSKDNLPLNYCEKHGSYDVLEKIDQNNPFALLARNELKENLKNTINALPEKEKLVLSLYYYEELTLKEIGLTLGLTESRICQIHAKAILQLRGRLQELRHDII